MTLHFDEKLRIDPHQIAVAMQEFRFQSSFATAIMFGKGLNWSLFGYGSHLYHFSVK